MVSVIIPTYNREKTIYNSIKSVLSQTYSDLELIVVDDCSSDDTEVIVKSIKDDRIRYIKHTTNRGACAARNTGLDYAKGSLIAFQDSDDIWIKDKLLLQINCLEKNKADIVFCAMNKHLYQSNSNFTFPVMENGFKSFEEILMGYFISTQTILGRKEVFQKHKFDVTMPRFQDYDIMIRISKEFSVYFIKDVLVDVFLQKDSITIKAKSNKNINEKNIRLKFLDKYQEIAENYPEWKVLNLIKIGCCQIKLKENCNNTFKEIYKYPSVFKNKLKSKNNKKNLIKYVLVKTRLLKVYFVIALTFKNVY